MWLTQSLACDPRGRLCHSENDVVSVRAGWVRERSNAISMRCLETPKDASDVQGKTKSKDAFSLGNQAAIVCTNCMHHISQATHRISIAGRHQHCFMNPSASIFTVGCFDEASGCAIWGDPSDEYSWFPKYQWTYAHCGKCTNHLGWHFTSPGEAFSFFCLILDRIIDLEENAQS